MQVQNSLRRNTGKMLSWLFFLLALQNLSAEEPSSGQMINASPSALGVQSLLKEGVHPQLRWGLFPDYVQPLENLYQSNAYLPIWTQNGKAIPQAPAIIESLKLADSKGLSAADYDAQRLYDWLNELNNKTANPYELASFDVALSLSLMRYASNLYAGRVNPHHVHFGLDITPKKLDLPALIKQIARSEHPEQDIAQLEPKIKLYENMKVALARYEALAKEPEIHLNLPDKFQPGSRHADVPALRRLLQVLGDLDAGAQGSNVYDKELVEAVKRYQMRHGMASDGTIGKATLEQLNTPITERIKQIQLGLERLRWLPGQLTGSYIIVNIPSFQLFGFSNGSAKPDMEMNVIVGEAANERNTPVFYADMTYVNFRPYWNLPYKITAKEMLPKILSNPGYLARNNLEIVSNFAPSSQVYQPSSGNIQMLSTGSLKLRQKPGPKNALGLVKFAFPNNNNVYLHSTPTQGLFKRARRDFSHGCIRVENPLELALWVLKDQGDWPKEKIEELMNGDKSKTVTLKAGLPVYIFYSTVLADETGKVTFFGDIYGHDQVLQGLLVKGFPYPA